MLSLFKVKLRSQKKSVVRPSAGMVLSFQVLDLSLLLTFSVSPKKLPNEDFVCYGSGCFTLFSHRLMIYTDRRIIVFNV